MLKAGLLEDIEYGLYDKLARNDFYASSSGIPILL